MCKELKYRGVSAVVLECQECHDDLPMVTHNGLMMCEDCYHKTVDEDIAEYEETREWREINVIRGSDFIIGYLDKLLERQRSRIGKDVA